MRNFLVIVIIGLLIFFAYSAFQSSPTVHESTRQETLQREGLSDIADELPTDSQTAVVELNSSFQKFFSSIGDTITDISKTINDYIDNII